MKSVGIPKMERITISYRVHCGPSHMLGYNDGRHRPKDCDNAVVALSACQDGIVDAGIVADDDAKHVRLGGIEVITDTDLCGVFVTIEEWTEE
jgi:hypothetical protein